MVINRQLAIAFINKKLLTFEEVWARSFFQVIID